MVGAGVGTGDKMALEIPPKATDQTRGTMVSLKEHIKNKIEKAQKWEQANPGHTWCSPEYLENEPKIYKTKDLVRSLAYRSLSRCAFLVYEDFLCLRVLKPIKRNGQKKWVIENNGEIAFTYEMAEERGFSRDQFRDAIDELQMKGFIDITHLGKGGRKPKKGMGDVTKFWIDDRWKDYDEKSKKSCRPPRIPRRKDTRKDRGWALYHDRNKNSKY